LYLDQDGFAHITPEMLDDGTIDNCFIDSTYLAVSSLNCQHGDSTIVIFYARDQSGNIDSQEVMVNVVDTISPVIKCQESFSTCDTLVYFEAPDATDACGIQDIVQTSGLEPNSFFPEGITTIVYQVIDVNGNESTCQFEVERYPLPVLKAPADTSVYFAEPIELNPKDSLVAYYMWEPSDFLDDPIREAPIARPTADIVYQVLGESVDGCLVRDEVSITVIHDINFAQAFSPNGDGVNDVFYIEGIDLYPNSVVYIVNRYGLPVFESVGYAEPWDGTYKGQQMPVGSYFFIIDLGDGGEQVSGTISIIR
jgi:gliding motility-associated-like protein